jgi:beta-glucosidase
VGFVWGVATSAYQVEGAVTEDGRGASIWDTFCRTPGTVHNGDTGDVACDQYHRFEEDAALMAELDVGAYRFSVAWPRIQPEGRGAANQRGLDHYRRLVSALNDRGIAPMLTLYHWDLPQSLQEVGGWANRETASRFAEYAAIVHASLADEVPSWITLNEPWVSAWLGYGSGVHAPGLRDDALALAATHHLLLAHGLAMETMGDAAGITLNLEPHHPATDHPDDVRAARLADLHMNALFLDPVHGRGYPKEIVEHYRDVSDFGFVHDGDLETIARPLDFLGVNYYRRHTVTAHPGGSVRVKDAPGSIGAWTIVPPEAPVTAMGWAIEPAGLTELLVRLHEDYAPARVFVTENGAAFDDAPDAAGAVADSDRVAFLGDHLLAAHAAIEAGVPLEGFFAWSLLDNFEWSLGYSKRFGLVYVDYTTQERTPKESARWYRDVVRRGGPPRA